MRRVSVVGNSGSGKSTVGRALAARLGVPFLELDSLRHQPGWVELPDDEFAARTAEFVAGSSGWVVDGNYSVVREPVVWPAADTVVWLDLPRVAVTAQVVRRTVGRVILRKELWNGNREPLRNLWSRDPMTSIIVWSWTNHHRNLARYEAALADPRWSHLSFVRLRSRAEIRRLLAAA